MSHMKSVPCETPFERQWCGCLLCPSCGTLQIVVPSTCQGHTFTVNVGGGNLDYRPLEQGSAQVKENAKPDSKKRRCPMDADGVCDCHLSWARCRRGLPAARTPG